MIPFVHLPNRSIISLRGAETSEFLERLLTNSVVSQLSSEARYSALLTPQGKVVADLILYRVDDATFLMDVPAEAADDLTKRLTLFKLRADVTIARREDLLVIASTSEASAEQAAIPGTVHLFEDPRTTSLRVRAFCDEVEWRRGLTISKSNDMVSLTDYHLDRIRLCLPEFGSDFESAEVFPSDINMDHMNGLDLSKGCFVGQEVVSRMHRRGKIRRRTVGLESQSPIAVGTPLTRGDVAIGEVSSWCETSGLARIRTDRLLATSESPFAGDTEIRIIVPDSLKSEIRSPTDEQAAANDS